MLLSLPLGPAHKCRRNPANAEQGLCGTKAREVPLEEPALPGCPRDQGDPRAAETGGFSPLPRVLAPICAVGRAPLVLGTVGCDMFAEGEISLE